MANRKFTTIAILLMTEDIIYNKIIVIYSPYG